MIVIKNISDHEAKEQITSLVDEIKICMCCIKGQQSPNKPRPIGVSKMDEDGNIWFLCNRHSYTPDPIVTGSSLELIYSEPGQSHLLTVYGIGIVTRSRNRVHELWTATTSDWFEHGLDDPNILLLKIIPNEAYYWDTKMEHMVGLVHKAKAA